MLCPLDRQRWRGPHRIGCGSVGIRSRFLGVGGMRTESIENRVRLIGLGGVRCALFHSEQGSRFVHHRWLWGRRCGGGRLLRLRGRSGSRALDLVGRRRGRFFSLSIRRRIWLSLAKCARREPGCQSSKHDAARSELGLPGCRTCLPARHVLIRLCHAQRLLTISNDRPALWVLGYCSRLKCCRAILGTSSSR